MYEKPSPIAILVMALTVLMPFGAILVGVGDEEAPMMNEATTVLEELANTPHYSFPVSLLASARAIAIIPNSLSGKQVASGRFGKGALVARNSEGKWTGPAFITLFGTGDLPSNGMSSGDVILVINNAEVVDALGRGQVELGSGVSVAPGPLGRYLEFGSHAPFSADVFSYWRARDTIVGIGAEGAVLQFDRYSNTRFYGAKGISLSSVLGMRSHDIPPAGCQLANLLARHSEASAVCG